MTLTETMYSNGYNEGLTLETVVDNGGWFVVVSFTTPCKCLSLVGTVPSDLDGSVSAFACVVSASKVERVSGRGTSVIP